VASGLIKPGGTSFAGESAFRFAHILTREVAHGELLKEERADLHERFARWAESRLGERAGEQAEILGYHLEQAYRFRTELRPPDEHDRALAVDAARRLGTAGRKAVAREDVPAAVNLLERAVSLLTEEETIRDDLVVKLAAALAETGEFTRASALLRGRIEDERRGRPFLSYRDDSGREHAVDLTGAGLTVSIGRRSASDVPLEWDTEVSRAHARLEREDGGWTLVDGGLSRNGSFVNGERVTGRRPLCDGDIMRFGASVVVFHAPPLQRPPSRRRTREGTSPHGESPPG
jgi:hypothetical protein